MMQVFGIASNEAIEPPLKFQTRHLFKLLRYTPCLKNCAKLFLSEHCQISTNFDNFWQKDDKKAKIMRDVLIFHLT